MQNSRYINTKVNKALCDIADGDKNAAAVIFDLLGKQIYFIAYSVLRIKADSEDVLQDTLIQVIQSADEYTPGTNAVAWILTIAKNKAITKLHGYVTVPLEETECPDEYARDNDLLSSSRLNEAMHRLDETDRLIVGMKVQLGYSLREIAKYLSLPLSTVEKRYQRAKIKLNEYYRN